VKFFSVKKNPFAGLGRNVAILGLVSFFTDASSDMIYLCSPSLLPSPWGQARQAILGLIEGVAESTASLVKLFSGWLSDKLQKRKSLAVAGYALASLTRPLIAMALASWHVLFIRFIDRIGKGIRTSPGDAFVADSEFRGKAFGFHRAMDHLGAIVGPILAMGVLWHRVNPGVAFLFGASLALLASFLLFGVKERKF